ncbi:MAG TPA: MOSC N-terminal beta barrel domain-containing protein [Polyangiales bacterium]
MPEISALHIYPVKGCAGIEVSGIRLDALGPLFDRRFMIVDDNGRFMTQREHPRMALIRVKLTPTALVLETEGMPKLTLDTATRSERRRHVQVWEAHLPAESLGHSAAQWLGEVLGTPCELVRFADDAVRIVDRRYVLDERRVGFADAFPMLIISEASLDALNLRLLQPVPMNRFRPNVVVSGTEPHAEDSWKLLRVGQLLIDVAKPCARCTVPTVDQTTGIAGKEPMATLARYRTKDHKVYFGQNCVHRDFGMLRVGDELEILETQSPLVCDA